MWRNVPQKLGDILRGNNKIKSPLLGRKDKRKLKKKRKDQKEEKMQGSKYIINRTYLSC